MWGATYLLQAKSRQTKQPITKPDQKKFTKPAKTHKAHYTLSETQTFWPNPKFVWKQMAYFLAKNASQLAASPISTVLLKFPKKKPAKKRGLKITQNIQQTIENHRRTKQTPLLPWPKHPLKTSLLSGRQRTTLKLLDVSSRENGGRGCDELP